MQRIAKIKVCEALVLDTDLRSRELGKAANILVTNDNPLENLRPTSTLTHVVKNGVFYDSSGSRWKKAKTFYQQTKNPLGLPGVKN